MWSQGTAEAVIYVPWGGMKSWILFFWSGRYGISQKWRIVTDKEEQGEGA